MVLLFLDTLVQAEIDSITAIDISVSADHGKGFLRATLVPKPLMV